MLSLELGIGIYDYQPISDLRERNKLKPNLETRRFAFGQFTNEEVHRAIVAGRKSGLDEYDSAFQTQGRLVGEDKLKMDHSKGEVCGCKKKSARRTNLSHLSGALVPFCGAFLLRISSRK